MKSAEQRFLDRVERRGSDAPVAPPERVRHCKADGCTNEVVFAGYCSTACFLDPNGEGY